MLRLLGPVLFLLAAAACDRSTAGSAAIPATSPAIEVSTASLEPRSITRRVRATGTLLGDEETAVAAKVSGRIVEVLKDLGDSVSPGDPLVRVDPVDYALALEERSRAFTQTLAKLGVTELPAANVDLSKLPAVVRARLQAENAKARFERGKQLYDRKPPLISQQEFADLKTTWDVADSNVNVEKLAAESILAEARTLEAQVSIARQRLNDTVHRTPSVEPSRPDDARAEASSYQVAQRGVSVGDFVQVGTLLYRLVDSDPVKLRASVPERQVASIQIGKIAKVRVDAYPDVFEGKVARVSPAVDIQTRTFIVEIRVDNPKSLLKPGSFATADIEVGIESVPTLPSASIISFAGVHRAFRIKEGKADERRVTLGERVGDRVEIKSGLDASDVVILKPPPSVATGTPVKVAGKAP